jgi:HEPN domain-containing protein
MHDPQHDEVKSWLTKAQRDLASARKLASGDEPILDTAIYHCQQAAEKAMKAFLTHHSLRFDKTHDIEVLVSQAATVDSRFAEWVETAESLTPYAAMFRYPGETLQPDQNEFDQALQMANDLCGFVLSVLPKEVRP